MNAIVLLLPLLFLVKPEISRVYPELAEKCKRAGPDVLHRRIGDQDEKNMKENEKD